MGVINSTLGSQLSGNSIADVVSQPVSTYIYGIGYMDDDVPDLI